MTTEQSKIKTFQAFHNRNNKALRYKVQVFIPSPETMYINLKMITRMGCVEFKFMEVLN